MTFKKQALKRKRATAFGLSMISIAALALGIGLSTVITSAGFGAGPISLRGETAINEGRAADEIFSLDESGRYIKNYRQQPRMIPHRIDKYEIDLKVNQCMRCHDWPNNVEEGAPKISETHYKDRDGKALDFVDRGRWFCTQCHVSQSDAAPLIRNTFRPVINTR